MEASLVATIAGLLGQWLSGRKQTEAIDLAEFLIWLSDHQHKAIRSMLEDNDKAQLGLKRLLANGVAEVTSKLDELAELQVLLASRVPELKDLVTALAPEIKIADDAYGILKQMDEHKTEFLLISKAIGRGPQLLASPGSVVYEGEGRYLHDDLKSLVSLGLLELDYNSSGDPMYRWTRRAASFVEKVEERSD